MDSKARQPHVELPVRHQVAVLDGIGLAPRLDWRARPVPGPGEVLIRVEACGLCGSDLFLQDGGFGNVFPVVPGHEAAGTIVQLSSGCADLNVGDVVAIWYIDNHPDGEWPRRGLPHLGPAVRRMGVDFDGALAEYVIRPAHTVIRPARPIPAAHLAVLTDAVATPYHALTAVADVRHGETVTVLGIGGIGSNAVQVAKALGARVVGVGRSRRSQDLALTLGADDVVSTEADPVASVAALTGEGSEVVVVCTDAPGAVRQAVRMCRPRGRVVLIAATREPMGIQSVELIWSEIVVLGSRGYTAEDIEAVQALYLDGEVAVDHLVADLRPMSEVAAAFESLRRGGSTRIVITPTPSA